MKEKKGWDEILPGACLFAYDNKINEDIMEIPKDSRKYSENSSFTNTVSDWRVIKPIFNAEHCINCQFCWVYCPDLSIIAKDKKFSHIDYDHCKGCGICVEVCPTGIKSLLMTDEFTSEEEAIKVWPTEKGGYNGETI